MIYFSDFDVAASSWTPADLGSTLQAWWDADTETVADGTALTTFHDRSGNAYDATLLSSGHRLLIYNVVNGKKVVRHAFANANGFSISGTLMNGKTAGTYLTVSKSSADPAGSTVAASAPLCQFGSQSSAGNPFGTHFPYTDGNIYDAFGTNSRVSWNPTPDLSTDFRIYCARAVSGDWTAWIDGTQDYNRASNTVDFGTWTRVMMRSENGISDFWFSGDVAEIMVFDSGLSTSDRQKAEGYLAHKYGLTANLPSGHPYKSVAP